MLEPWELSSVFGLMAVREPFDIPGLCLLLGPKGSPWVENWVLLVKGAFTVLGDGLLKSIEPSVH